MNVEVFVKNVKYWCKLKGEPVTTACEKCGAGKSFVSNLKGGSSPSVDKVQQLAKYLGCTVSDLLGERNGRSLSPEEDRLLAEFDLLNARNQERIWDFLAGLSASQDNP